MTEIIIIIIIITRIVTHGNLHLLLVLIQAYNESDLNCLPLKLKDVTYPYMQNYEVLKGKTTSEDDTRAPFLMTNL